VPQNNSGSADANRPAHFIFFVGFRIAVIVIFHYLDGKWLFQKAFPLSVSFSVP
jgi:hypothetical protein